jgi:hypothetical protein
MVILGLPLAVPVFVLSFILGFIPYIGSFVSTGIAFLIAIAAGSPADVAIMAVFTVVFNIVQGNIVSPVVYGRTVHLHPAIVLLAIPAGAAVAGILGMFLVVPTLGVIAATWRLLIAALGDDVAQPSADVPEQPLTTETIAEAGIAAAGIAEARIAEAGIAEAGIAEAGIAEASIAEAGIAEASIAEANA